MRKTINWTVETAAMLALLIVLQWATKPLGQMITGSCVNAVLAVTVLLAGMGSGIMVALLSPVFACLFGIAPNLVVVPAIMAGNTVFILLLRLVYGSGKQFWRQVVALLATSTAKFLVLYALVAVVICGTASNVLLARGVLKAPMLAALPATFSWLQLMTALIGGGLALVLVPTLKKALHRG